MDQSQKVFQLLISVARGTHLFAWALESDVKKIDADLQRVRGELESVPKDKTVLFSLAAAGGVPQLTVDVRTIIGWYWTEARPNAQDRIATTLEKTVEKENEGDSWKDR